MMIQRRRLIPGIAIARTVLAFLAPGVLLHAATFVVSPAGKDSNTGTGDAPFATLEAARDAARKADGGPHRIVVNPGDYFLSKTFELGLQDNGLTVEGVDGGKATLYGGTPVTGWTRDGDTFWSADVAGVKEGIWDFRALVVNGRMPPRARMPAEGTFLHKSIWNVRYLSNIAGGFERKPTAEEATTLLYDPEDIPTTLDPRNAEVRVYHMWSESLVPVARNDTARHALIFAGKPTSPPGAFKVYKYVVFNTREGMTQPGQWYLDRTAGKVVYWPLPEEDMSRAKVVAPRLQRIVSIMGTKEQSIEGVTLRGLGLEAATTPIDMQGSFAAGAFDGALRIEYAKGCALEQLEICNVGGQGIQTQRYGRTLSECRITDCHVHHTGACGVLVSGSDLSIIGNHIHHVGVYYPSAVALHGRGISEKGLHIRRNEIHDGPYSGIIGGGEGNLIEENLIYRVMQEMHDGGAIYGNMRNTVLRGNMVRDVVAVGKGYGASAYYLDEGAIDCIVERNVSVGVKRPTHNHIARNITIRDNVFINDGDMQISAARSAGLIFERNTLFASGKVTVSPPNAFKIWQDNVLFRNGVGADGSPQAFTISEAMPAAPTPERRTTPARVERMAQAPVLDGEIGLAEWPDGLLRLDRAPSRWPASGAPIFSRMGYDERCLYIAVNVPCFDATKISKGTTWGTDDGVEVAIEGKMPEGTHTTFVLRGFTEGALQSVTDAGAPAEAAKHLEQAIQFCAKPWKAKWNVRGGWRAELAVPFSAVGLEAKAGLKVSFNLSVYRAEDEVWRCWEGTLAETWQLDEGGTLELVDGPKRPPVVHAPEGPAPLLDGTINAEEWGKPASTFGPDGAVTVWLRHEGETLYVAFRNKVDPTRPLKTDSAWDTNDAVEVALRNAPKAPIAVLRGYPNGDFSSGSEAGAPPALAEAVKKGSAYMARIVSPSEWTSEWRIPLEPFGLTKTATPRLDINLTLHRVANGNEWLSWRRDRGSSWALDTAGGTLILDGR